MLFIYGEVVLFEPRSLVGGFPSKEQAKAATKSKFVDAKAGALKVKGTKLCDKTGNPVQLRGVSTHGLS